MLQLGGEEHLPAEAFNRDAGEEFGREHLDDHPAAEGTLDGDISAGHAATTELALEVVGVGKGALDARPNIVRHAGPLWGALNNGGKAAGRLGGRFGVSP